MNKKTSKSLRALATTLATEIDGMHPLKGTTRVKTETDASGKILGRVQTCTMVHRENSARNIYKRLKKDEVGTLRELGVIS